MKNSVGWGLNQVRVYKMFSKILICRVSVVITATL